MSSVPLKFTDYDRYYRFTDIRTRLDAEGSENDIRINSRGTRTLLRLWRL